MARKVTPEERIEEYFRTCTTDDALTQRDRIELILRTRGIVGVQPKRGRKPKAKPKPALVPEGGAA